MMVFLGVIWSSSFSKASPKPRSSSTTLNRAPVGVLERVDISVDEGSSLAVVKDSARDDGWVKGMGRSGVGMDAVVLR
jgi:hypothetical protein